MEIKRLAYKEIEKALKNIGMLFITGPKFCGKTFAAQKYANSQIYITPRVVEDIARLGDNVFLKGDNPRLIDEWQIYPQIFDSVRHEVDIRNESNTGLFLLTGSSKPINAKEIDHSGFGRAAWIQMQTLTFCEILNLDESHTISLNDLFLGKPFKNINNQYSVEDVDEMLLKGGWPSIISHQDLDYMFLIKNYVTALTKITTKEEQEYGYVFKKNPSDLLQLLKSIARLSASQINKSTIIKDFRGDINIATLDKYLKLLYDNDVIFDVFPWKNRNIHSPYDLRTKPKTYFCDTSLVCHLLSITNIDQFLNDGNTTGIIFETQVMKDLTVYAQCIGAKLYFYRDSNGNEIDAILELNNGEWAAIEIKLSLTTALTASEKLMKVIKTLNIEEKKHQPKFCMIITNCDQTYQDKNGVYIVPHTLLRP